MTADSLLALLLAFFASWQVKTLMGLILLDVLLGVASALRRGVFDFALVANFYRTNVIPFVLGYLAFYIAIGFLIPPDALGGLGDPVSQGTITLAWAVLVGSLVKSIAFNFRELYSGV
jgi:hypothetical protein